MDKLRIKHIVALLCFASEMACFKDLHILPLGGKQQAVPPQQSALSVGAVWTSVAAEPHYPLPPGHSD